LGALENEIEGIGVLYGFGNQDELMDAGAAYIVATAPELLTIID
jgi:phosphoglycolate phosphatase